VSARRKAAQRRRNSSIVRGPARSGLTPTSPKAPRSTSRNTSRNIWTKLDGELSSQRPTGLDRPDKNWTTAMRFGKDFKDFVSVSPR